MASSYNPLVTTPKDKARLLLGDTGVDSNAIFLLTDEEITAFLGTVPFNEAVALLAEGLAARFAQYPDETETAGGSKLKWTERVKTWLELAKRLRLAPNVNASGPRAAVAKLGTLTSPPDPTSGIRGIR